MSICQGLDKVNLSFSLLLRGENWCQAPINLKPYRMSKRALLSKLLIRGHLNSINSVITQPLTGKMMVESLEASLPSMEQQLVPGRHVGVQMDNPTMPQTFRIFRLLVGMFVKTSGFRYTWSPAVHLPTLETTNFKVEFEVSIVVLLCGDHLIREKLCRMQTRRRECGHQRGWWRCSWYLTLTGAKASIIDLFSWLFCIRNGPKPSDHNHLLL